VGMVVGVVEFFNCEHKIKIIDPLNFGGHFVLLGSRRA